MPDQILRIKDELGNIHDLAFPADGLGNYGLLITGDVGLEAGTLNSLAVGSTADAEAATGNGTVIAILKNLRTRLDTLDSVDYATQATLAQILSAVDGLEALLTQIQNNTDTVEPSLTTIAGHVDGLEGSIGAITDLDTANTVIGRLKQLITLFSAEDFASNSTLLQIRDYLDSVETKLDVLHADLDTVEPKLQAIADNTDGLETSIGLITDLDTANTVIGRLKQLITLFNAEDFASNATLIQIRDYLDTVETKIQAVADNTDGLESAIGTTADLDTANTVIGRLKQLVTLFNAEDFATNATLNQVLASVDGLEALLTAIRDNTDTLEINTDQLEAKLDTVNANLGTVNTNLTTIDSRVDGLEGSIGTITDLDTANTVIGRLKQLVTLINTEDFASQTTLAAVLAAVDGVEPLLTSIRDNTDTLEVNTDQLEAKLDTTVARLDTLITHVDTLEAKSQSLLDATPVLSLTARMKAGQPSLNYRIWSDTANASYIYLAEAPMDTTDQTTEVWRGIRIPKDVNGNLVGEWQESTAFRWDTKVSTSGWS